MNYLTAEDKKKIAAVVLEVADAIGERVANRIINAENKNSESEMYSAMYEIQDYLGDFCVNDDSDGIRIPD